ncbi:MAG: helix-turn-helix domain-containing protein [Syntrophobacterales bacterium]|nr:MAG: helix-turn-helix domain-containing protein [Syntrophobacterales bacterium]
MKRIKDQTYYEMLEVDRRASTEEIREAYRREKEIFSSDSVATYSLLGSEELKRINAAIDEAYRVLTDKRLRSEYDRRLNALDEKAFSGEPLGPPAIGEVHPPREEPTGISFPHGFRFTGSSLKGIRESMGIDLKQISQTTKISKQNLEWLEEESFGNLPALVYIRGFIMEYAKALNLDPHRVADNYLRSFYQWQNEQKV